ncbi:cupin [Sphingorhabdus soli]|uniref:Cupin n=1 Tax=Flavisphingopyxis soli TaxID=2601267 RepID=A0A5C6UMD1_9SPHN|nr:cupin [Sphingorhabdus soli]TXC74079.1 cupin [Sphingorhabdus soli]
MQTYDAASLQGPVDWSGPTLPAIAGAAVKLRWINSPFRWHRNTGAEVFCVLDGEVDMHVRTGPSAKANVVRLGRGQLMLIEDGEEHVAYPLGEARILVIENEDSE